jgi:hypothetical protein
MRSIIEKTIVVGVFALVAACGKKEVAAADPSASAAPAASASAVATADPSASASAAPSVTAAAATPPTVHVAAHPAYLHALADLRNARFNLQRKGGDPAMKWSEGSAIGAIDGAIREIKLAAIDDGKDLSDHQPVDAHEPFKGRLHKALAALHAAHADVSGEEDNAYAQGLKARAIHHIDEAIHLTEQGIALIH